MGRRRPRRRHGGDPLHQDPVRDHGGGVDADLRVPTPDMSRLHASVRLEHAKPTVRDLGSSNGTIVRGAAIAQGIAMRAKMGNASSPDAALRGARARLMAELGWQVAQRA